MLATSVGKKRLVGLLLLVAIVALFLSFNRFPKLDIVGEDLDAVSAPEVQCFQGFCIEREPGESLFKRWWVFSLTYLRLVALGMTFAFVVAGIAEAFLFPPGSARGVFSGRTLRQTATGMAIGPVMNLCSACIVPVSSAFQRKGIGIAGSIAMVQSSATMNIPALAMVFFVFSPLLGFSRLFLAIIGAILIGPIVVLAVRRKQQEEEQPWISVEEMPDPLLSPGDDSWGPALREGFRDWAKSSIGYLLRLGPIMVIAGFASGLVIQWINPQVIPQYLGNDVQGVVIAATFGLLINVPLLFEIPLVALLLLFGMGTAPAATLLFTAAAGGPITFWGLSKVMPKRAVGAFAAATWILGAVGGLAVMGIGAFIWEDSGSAQVTEASSPTVRLTEDEIRARGVRPATFVDVSESAGLDFAHARDDALFNFGGGAAAGDYNGDGLTDIYVTNSAGSNALYRNDGDGGFTNVAQAAGVNDKRSRGHGAGWGDYDNDGDLDLFVANYGDSKLFRNLGDGTFVDVTGQARVGDPDASYRTTGVAWGDYNRDGCLDLLVVRHVDDTSFGLRALGRAFEENARPLALYRNDCNGTFSQVTELLGDGVGFPSAVKGAGFKPAFFDYDNDGDQDIYVVNDFGEENQPNVLWRNDGPDSSGDWKFVDVSKAAGVDLAIFGMGLAIGDYDRDGDLDMYMTDIAASEFLENRGDGVFDNVTIRTGVGRGILPGTDADESDGWGAAFADLDNDGLLDLYYVAGQIDYNDKELWALYYDTGRSDIKLYQTPLDQPNAVFMNAGDGTFLDVSHLSGADDPGTGREVAVADFNDDGLLDLAVVNMGRLNGEFGPLRLFRNTTDTDNHWLQIKTVGTTSNRDGMGARITIQAGSVTQIREVGAAQGHISHSVVPVHFGLGESTMVDWIEVRWPSGQVQTVTNVPVDQTLTLIEPA